VETRSSALLIRPADAGDAAGIARIYNYYVPSTVVTFEEAEVSADEMARRIEEVGTASLPWLVAEREGRVVGYAYATKWRGRRAYRFSAEVTVYVDMACAGSGIGSRLYEELLPALRAGGIHAVMGGIALPNDASVALHEKFGFSKVAHFKEVGFKFERWIDVGYWQLNLSAG
jgi:phosphinothricin acetyltransferase